MLERQPYELPETRICPVCGARFGRCGHSEPFAETRTIELLPPKSFRPVRHVEWDEQELTRLRSYRARGMTNTQIADRLNRTLGSVNGMSYRIGRDSVQC